MKTVTSNSKQGIIRIVRRGIACCLFASAAALGLLAAYMARAQGPPPLTQTLKVEVEGMGITISYPEGWSVSPKQFINMNELINVAADQQNTAEATASIKILSQTRTDHAEAVHELKEIAAEEDSPSTFLNIGGWPALQRRHLERTPQPSKGPMSPHEMELRITTAVAAGNLLVRLDGVIPSDADQNLISVVEAVGRSLVFTVTGNPDQGREELENLRNRARQKFSLSVPPPPAPDAFSAGSVPSESQGFSEESAPGPGSAQRLFTGGNGELEIALSPDGQDIVIARQNDFKTSNDGGRTFLFSGSLNLGDGDPSLAFGQSGNFYLAGVRPDCKPGFDCTGILRATNNRGRSFSLLSNAVECPKTGANFCFPDQEHIAADRVNAAPGGDQVYSTWRNFHNGVTPAIVCSQDSGVTWTAPLAVESGQDFPRITIGQDGFVYVVYRAGSKTIRINKYSSCENGLRVQPTFPKTIAGFTEVACPVPGLDRCNDGNSLSSIMVAVDDTNPNHVYVAYANQPRPGNQDIVVRDSLDGGVSWPAARKATINSAVSGVRFMPWVCTTGGKALVTWYDRRAATAANNDLTDYFAGSARLDSLGNLVAGPEFRLTDASDPQCAGGFDSGSPASWPCAPRAKGDSESCSVQVQLAGLCCAVPLDKFGNCPPGKGGEFQCDFSDAGGCPAGETYRTGRGCPKYGDYNGNACAAGRLFAAWASGTLPSGNQALGIDVFFTVALPHTASTWNLNPVSGDWNANANWTPMFAPNGPADIATFDVSSITDVSLSANTEVSDIVFNQGASAFTITASPTLDLFITGMGITNNSGKTQNFVAANDGAGNFGEIEFTNGATAGNMTVFTSGGIIDFVGTSNAGSATFNGGLIQFDNKASAEHGTFNNNGGANFAAGRGITDFFSNSTAGNGTFNNNGGTKSDTFGGFTQFFDTSHAGNGTFINDTGMVSGAHGGMTFFFGSSHADNATLKGFGGGTAAGRVEFESDSTGDTARVSLLGDAVVDISPHNPPGMTIGSIEGGGFVFLGANNLRVGSNNRNTIFEGLIQDGGDGGGTGGSLTKIGEGNLALTNANTYTGGTSISDGKLVVTNTSGSGTGSGAVQVRDRLAGTGTIAGAVTVGKGTKSAPRAVLSPGTDEVSLGTLTIQSTLMFNSDASYHFGLNSSNATADEVVANGVTINSGAQFLFRDFGNGKLTAGTVFIVIDNTAATAIAGTFSNLAQGSTFTNKGNTYKANYKGGDGNDLTLTVQ